MLVNGRWRVRLPLLARITGRFNHFVNLAIAPIAFGWSGLPSGAFTYREAPPLHGASEKPTDNLA